MFFNKEKKKQKAEALKIMEDFSEGKITTKDFWEIYKNSPIMQSIIIKDNKRPNEGDWFFNAEKFLENIDITNCGHRVEVFTKISNYFRRRKIQLNYYNEECEILSFMLDCLPKHIFFHDENYLLYVYKSIPPELSEKDKKEWCKNKFEENFKYISTKPRWALDPEWPIIDGVPYVFSHQKTADAGFEQFFFFDPNDKNIQIIVEQPLD